ncbi:MAG: hypothetical protein JW941_05000 [Candidatus Coatesbacteria bacterium]|nr:hypothetical protein [Candidatus Coatesbacteria bacterium]
MPKDDSSDSGQDSLTFGKGFRRVPIDAKGRISIPNAYRSLYQDELRGDWVVYLVADRFRIDVLPREKYEEKYKRIIGKDSHHPDDINERRRFMVGTEIKGLDPEGRLTISKEMQKMVKLGAYAVLIWMRGWLEIWPEVEFDAWLTSAPSIDDFERRASERSSLKQTAADSREESIEDSSGQ